MSDNRKHQLGVIGQVGIVEAVKVLNSAEGIRGLGEGGMGDIKCNIDINM